jgi:hypothetical protein
LSFIGDAIVVAVVDAMPVRYPVGEFSGCGGARRDWTERMDEFEGLCRMTGCLPETCRERGAFDAASAVSARSVVLGGAVSGEVEIG